MEQENNSTETQETNLTETTSHEVLVLNTANEATVRDAFKEFQDKIQGFLTESRAIVVTDATQVSLMAKAKRMRLDITPVLSAIEARRKELKDESLNRGRMIDRVAKDISEELEAEKKRLKEQEEFAKNAELKMQTDRMMGRIKELDELGFDHQYINLLEMAEPQYQNLLDTARADKKRREDEAAATAEKQRVDKLRNDRTVELGGLLHFDDRTDVEDLGSLSDEAYAAYKKELEAARDKKVEEDEQQKRDLAEAKRLADEAEEKAEKQREADKKAMEEKQALNQQRERDIIALGFTFAGGKLVFDNITADVKDWAAMSEQEFKSLYDLLGKQIHDRRNELQKEQADRDEAIRIENERKAKEQAEKAAEDKRLAEEKAQKEALEQAGDIDKLRTCYKYIQDMPRPKMTNETTELYFQQFTSAIDKAMSDLANGIKKLK